MFSYEGWGDGDTRNIRRLTQARNYHTGTTGTKTENRGVRVGPLSGTNIGTILGPAILLFLPSVDGVPITENVAPRLAKRVKTGTRIASSPAADAERKLCGALPNPGVQTRQRKGTNEDVRRVMHLHDIAARLFKIRDACALDPAMLNRPADFSSRLPVSSAWH